MNHKKTTLSPDTLYKQYGSSFEDDYITTGYKICDPPFNSNVDDDELLNTGDRTLKSYLMKMTTPYMAEHPVIFQVSNIFDDGYKI